MEDTLGSTEFTYEAANWIRCRRFVYETMSTAIAEAVAFLGGDACEQLNCLV